MKRSWFSRLKDGLGKSSTRLTRGITEAFTKRKLDDEALEELEELLITADIGVSTASDFVQTLAKGRFDKEITEEEIRRVFAGEIEKILEPVAQPFKLDKTKKPYVVLMVGVNGSGKTTTMGKMAKQFKDQGLSVMFAACDTFRAAAVEQLMIWGERTGSEVVSAKTGADAAGLSFDAFKKAKEQDVDVLMIDTAGRLQNKKNLMAELEKIVRVIKKIDEEAPHSCLLVLDATVGQNAHSQVQVFKDITDVSGLVVTKLDGTAKGGVVVALAKKFALPIHYIGVGETADDLHSFKASDYAQSLLGL